MLSQIQTGMTVYDKQNDKIGTVKYVQFGSGQTVDAPEVRQAAEFDAVHPLQALKEGLTSDNDVPSEISQRLAQAGFVEIDTGLLQSSAYAMPSQIVRVKENRVILNVAEDELLKV